MKIERFILRTIQIFVLFIPLWEPESAVHATLGAILIQLFIMENHDS